jgi:hypothetical protein
MSACKACGATIRKGRRAFIIGSGMRTRGLVCRTCAAGGTLVVVSVKRRAPRPVLKEDLEDTFGIELDPRKVTS